MKETENQTNTNHSSDLYEGLRFYQYKPDVKGRDLETLIEKKIFYASVEKLNDPSEFAALEALKGNIRAQEDYLKAGVACFCRSLTNPLLWSHYANSHKGFAIAYNAVDSHFIGSGPYPKGKIIWDVKYEDIVPSLDHSTIKGVLNAAMFTKPTCWAYEQEVRILRTPGNQKYSVPAGTIKEIFFGFRMLPERVNEIIKEVKKTDIDATFYQMKPLHEGYGFKPEYIQSSAEQSVAPER